MDSVYRGASWVLGQSLSAYIVRGGLGIGLIIAGFMQIGAHPYLGFGLMVTALVPLGGCPTCWLSGTIGAACAYRPQRNLPPKQ